MTSAQYLAAIRQGLNDETASTYKWSDAEIVNYINSSFDDLSEDTEYFRDAYTTAIVEIALVAGTADYALDSRILKINSARVSGETVNLSQMDMQDLMDYSITWRYKNSIYGTDIAFTDNTPLVDTITCTTTDFTDANFEDTDYLEITGCVTAANNKVVLCSDVAATTITLASGVTLTTRVAGDPILLRSVNTDTPIKYTTDYRDDYITLYPAPNEVRKLFMHVNRYPLVPWTTANYSTETIPFNSHYHQALINGPLSLAYLKSGPSTFNIDKSQIHEGKFTLLKKRIKRDLINMRNQGTILSPHNGAM